MYFKIECQLASECFTMYISFIRTLNTRFFYDLAIPKLNFKHKTFHSHKKLQAIAGIIPSQLFLPE